MNLLILKQCTKCKEEKSLESFCKNKQNKDKLDTQCKVCKKASTDRWRKENPDKIKAYSKKWPAENREKSRALKILYKTRHPERAKQQVRNAHSKYGHIYKEKYAASCKNSRLQKTYGITLEDYNNLLASQNGLCAICCKSQSCGKRDRLYVDHCHKTGKVRGLLCHKCNVLLGAACDDVDILIKSMKYLKQ